VAAAQSYGAFHAYLALGGAYVAELLLRSSSAAEAGATAAGATAADAAAGGGAGGAAGGAYWAAFGGVVGSVLVYGWVLLAPWLLRDYRDFGVEFEDD
jgi:hypothetical protein